ncbi:MAG: hypothetical protein LBG25_04890 [Spirochaetaceae bacterium]|jgi:translation initiation factor 2B subunit (eIF-2B alpha/beta/delta family)|nr:hypothetical protein [Spirochaetaceae bacterium]
MKSKYKMVFLAGILVIFSLVSCKSTPAPSEPAPAEPAVPPAAPAAPQPDPDRGPPDQAAIDALAAAKARVEASRTMAIDVEGSRYFPEDWEGVENQYRSLGEPAPATLGEFRAAVETYQRVADAYDDLARKSLPRYAADRERELQEARQGAIDAGAVVLTPDRLSLADALVDKAKSQYAGGDYYPAAASAAAALDRYNALKIGLVAYFIREQIIINDFAKYNPVNFDFADKIGLEAISDYDAGHTKDALNKAEQAILWYALLLDTGWETFASGHGAAAAELQQAAYSLKAHVALKKEYDDAVKTLTQGDVLFSDRRFPDAVSFYIRAKSQFIVVRDAAEEKRRLAEKAIQEAEERVNESDEKARDAEIILEGDTL